MNAKDGAFDNGGEKGGSNLEMFNVFDIGLDAHRAEELANGGVALTCAVEDLDLRFGAEVDRFPVALELGMTFGSGANDGLVGDDISGLQAIPAPFMKDERLALKRDDLPVVGHGGRCADDRQPYRPFARAFQHPSAP